MVIRKGRGPEGAPSGAVTHRAGTDVAHAKAARRPPGNLPAPHPREDKAGECAEVEVGTEMGPLAALSPQHRGHATPDPASCRAGHAPSQGRPCPFPGPATPPPQEPLGRSQYGLALKGPGWRHKSPATVAPLGQLAGLAAAPELPESTPLPRAGHAPSQDRPRPFPGPATPPRSRWAAPRTAWRLRDRDGDTRARPRWPHWGNSQGSLQPLSSLSPFPGISTQ